MATTFVAEPFPLLGTGTTAPDIPAGTAWRVDHVVTPLPIYRPVKMALGEERRRRVHRSAPMTVALTRELTAEQAQLWRLWWEEDVESGAQGFKAVIANLNTGVGTGEANLIARGQPKYKPLGDGNYWEISIEATVVSYGSVAPPPPPVVLPAPFWADTFTAADNTNPVGRTLETFANYDGMRQWQDLLAGSGNIVSGALAPNDDPALRFYDYQLAIVPTTNIQSFSAAVSVTFVIKITFDAVRLMLNDISEEKVRIDLNIGSVLQPRLDFYHNGKYEVITPDQTYSGPQVGGGTFTYVLHIEFLGSNVSRRTFYANGVLVGQGAGVGNLAYTPNISMLGIFEYIHPTEVRCYTDLTQAQMLSLVGTAVTPTPIPSFPTPPATLTTIVRDTFTAADGTLPTARLADVYPTNLFDGPDWFANGTDPGVIQSNRLILTDGSKYVTNFIEGTNYRWRGALIPTFPMTLFLHGAAGTRSSATGQTPEVYVSWGYPGYFYFDIAIREDNRYMGSAAGYVWQSTGYGTASAPSAGAGTHKLAMFYDGTNAYLILNGAVVQTSPDISSTVVDPANSSAFAVEMGSNALAGYTNTYAEEVGLYYGGTLAQAIALTA